MSRIREFGKLAIDAINSTFATPRLLQLETCIKSGHRSLAHFLSSQSGAHRETTQRDTARGNIFLALYEFEKVFDAPITTDASPKVSRSRTQESRWSLKGPSHFISHQAYAERDTHWQSLTPRRIMFLRGYPSPDWLRTIVATHSVDLEFLSRWLDFPHANVRHKEFGAPTLRPDDWNLLELPMISIGKREQVYPYSRQLTTDAAQLESDSNMRDYHNRLYDQTDGTVGDSVARDIYHLDDTHFAIEQKITILIRTIVFHDIVLRHELQRIGEPVDLELVCHDCAHHVDTDTDTQCRRCTTLGCMRGRAQKVQGETC